MSHGTHHRVRSQSWRVLSTPPPPRIPRQRYNDFEAAALVSWGLFLAACAGYVLWQLIAR